MNYKSTTAKITIILVLTLLSLPFPAANATSRLDVGSWWTVKGTYQTSNSGTGSDQGSYTETGNYTIRFFVSSSDSNTMTIRIHTYGAYSCTAEGSSWKCNPPTGTWSNDREYTIATNTLSILSFTRNGKANPWSLGHPVWFLTSPSKLTDRGTTPILWCVPTSDAKDCPATDVQASVSTQQLSLKGISVKVWVVTYTGQTIGRYNNKDGVHSTGPETDTYLYDPAYGIYLGGSWKWSFNGVETGGGGTWTEGYEENNQFEDTSLTFTSTVTIQLQPSTNLAITIDGVKYNSNQLPTTFKWFIGTTHSLVVNSTIMGSDGVRYVFGQWSDGSTENSRNFISAEDTTLTATFKTQYLLTVVSDVGNPQGSGWYDAGTQATFSVLSTPQAESGFLGALGGKLAFQGWSGDSNAGSPSATINMDGPKTVTAMWTVDNTQPYIILAGIAAVIVVVSALALFMKRRKH